MAIVNKTVTILGGTAALKSFSVHPQPDGTFRVSIIGTVSDGANFVDQIETSATFAGNVTALVNMAAAALTRLRQDNGFES